MPQTKTAGTDTMNSAVRSFGQGLCNQRVLLSAIVGNQRWPYVVFNRTLMYESYAMIKKAVIQKVPYCNDDR